MTQPGVYYALDAPFVRVLALFSNALEDPGVISSENNYWPKVRDYQLEFLEEQLQRIKRQRNEGAAVLIAVHHPPFSYAVKTKGKMSGGVHRGSAKMLKQIDTICNKVGVYPHAFLSGHAHRKYATALPPWLWPIRKIFSLFELD